MMRVIIILIARHCYNRIIMMRVIIILKARHSYYRIIMLRMIITLVARHCYRVSSDLKSQEISLIMGIWGILLMAREKMMCIVRVA